MADEAIELKKWRPEGYLNKGLSKMKLSQSNN
jgi:hypothetical protein